jgi:hypothetical protein
MIDDIKKLYEGYLIEDIEDTDNPDDYKWYSDKNGTHFGIYSEKLTSEEKKLIELIFLPILPPVQSLSKREKFWHSILFGNTTIDDSFKVPSFHFIYFHIKQQEFETLSFTQLIKELFQNEISILWKGPQNGVIINEGEKATLQYSEIIDTITTELLIDFSLFIGNDATLYQARSMYQIEHNLFSTSRSKFPNQKLYRPEKIYPFILIDHLDAKTKEYFFNTILKETKEDRELLHTIKVYLENNMNLSLAAKKLFIHRNSLQYRVDKFVEKTGIDVKQFENAVSIYLGLLLNKK